MTFYSSDYRLTFAAPPTTTIKPDNVKVSLGAEFNACTTEMFQSAIDDVWDAKKKKYPDVQLFNGLKFRLGGVHSEGDTVELQVGVTDYKSFIGSHYLEESLLQECLAGDDHDKYMSHALGVESLVASSDGVLVFIRRSDQVAEYPGFYCGPGGHAEPKKVIKNPNPDHARLIDDMAGKEAAVLKEMFESSLDEVVEELGLPRETLNLLGLLGVAVNTRTRNKPDLLYFIQCSLTADEIKAIYQKGEMAEKFESSQILLTRFDKTDLAKMIADNKLTPPTAAAVHLLLQCGDLSDLHYSFEPLSDIKHTTVKMPVKLPPPDVTDEEVEQHITAMTAKGGAWKEAKKGEKTYYYEKETKRSVYKKEMMKIAKGNLEAKIDADRQTAIEKKVKELLKNGIWKKVNGKKPYFYNPKNKKEVVWDLEEVVAKQLGYIDGTSGKNKPAAKEDNVAEETPSPKPEASPKKSEPEPEAEPEPELMQDEPELKPEDPEPVLEQGGALDLPDPPVKMKPLVVVPEPSQIPSSSPSPVPALAEVPAQVSPSPEPAKPIQTGPTEEELRQMREAEANTMRLAFEACEITERIALHGNEEVERLVVAEIYQRSMLQQVAAYDLERSLQLLSTSAVSALQQQMRMEVAYEEDLSFQQITAFAITSIAHYYKLQLERELTERMVLCEIETEVRQSVMEEEELCRDALTIVERRHHVWAAEVTALVKAWIDFTRSKFEEFLIDGVKELETMKEMEATDRKICELRAAQKEDCQVCEKMGRKEIVNDWEAGTQSLLDDLAAVYKKYEEERRRINELPKASTERQLHLIRQQMKELGSTKGSPQRLVRLQEDAKSCEIARITARVRALEDDSKQHREKLAQLRDTKAGRLASTTSGAPEKVLEPLKLQIDALRALQSHSAAAQPPNSQHGYQPHFQQHQHQHQQHYQQHQSQPNPQEVFGQLLAAFYTRYDPGKIQNIPSLLHQFHNQEAVLFTALVKKYKLPTDNPYRDSLHSLMTRHTPWQLPSIDVILHLYEGAEYDLISHLMKTYEHSNAH